MGNNLSKNLNYKTNSNKEIKFLIIVPILNPTHVVKDLIKSVINQTYKNWRLVFIDGNSDEQNIKNIKAISRKDKRIKIETQSKFEVGIFGAMNQGFKLAQQDEWIIFWGSDDFAINEKVLSSLNTQINKSKNHKIDLLIYGAQYINLTSRKKGRKSIFLFKNSILKSEEYNHYLFSGFAPPHQGCIFSPKLIKRRSFYQKGFYLSADLDYFLQISKLKNLVIFNCNQIIVMMGDGGVSGKYTVRRLLEVRKAYKRRFGKIWIIPVFLRYVRRILSLLY